MYVNVFVKDWLAAADAFDMDKWVSCFHKNAILDDSSVGHQFAGHNGIRQYFTDYFIGYNTQTRLVDLQVIDDGMVHVEVDFTGDFPGGQTGGVFDLRLEDNKIAFARAELI